MGAIWGYMGLYQISLSLQHGRSSTSSQRERMRERDSFFVVGEEAAEGQRHRFLFSPFDAGTTVPTVLRFQIALHSPPPPPLCFFSFLLTRSLSLIICFVFDLRSRRAREQGGGGETRTQSGDLLTLITLIILITLITIITLITLLALPVLV